MTGYGADGLYVSGEGKEYGCKIQLPGKEECGLFDACILYELTELWRQGIKTKCSCCGHGEIDARIAVADECVSAIEALGYERCEPLEYGCVTVGGDGCCRHWYKAKSKLICKETRNDV